MERETKTLTTPLGKELKVKTYITAGERNKVRGVFLSSMKIDPNNGGKVQEIGGDTLEVAEHAYIDSVVVSYDGSTENILGRLLESSPDEYDFVVGAANKIGGGNFLKAK